MIARVEGTLVELTPTRVIVDVGGVGYEIHVPLSTFTQLPDVGEPVSLLTHTHAPEGSLQLFGFLTRAERVAFDLLLCANRVGPRLAITILSGISPTALFSALRNSDVSVLRSAPGVGTKLAERIVVELRDRASELAAVLASSHDGAEPDGLTAPTGQEDVLQEQTLSALVNLGYPKAQAERAIAAAMAQSGEPPSLEELVRGSLKMLVKS